MLPPTIARSLAGSFAVAAVLGGVALPASAASTEAQQIAAGVITQMRASTQQARERANAIAAAPSLVYAVGTDQQTMLDMTADELSLHVQPGEIVEVGQRQLASGKVLSLRREGSDDALVHLPLQSAGQFIVSEGERLYALAVVEVRPRERANVVRGLVGVARAIDLAAASARLERLGAGAIIRTGSGSVAIGHSPSSSSPVELHAAVGVAVEPQLTLLVPTSHGSLVGGLTAIGLAAFVVAFVLVRRRRASQGAVAYRDVPTAH